MVGYSADEQKEKIDKLEKTVQDLQEKLNEELAKGKPGDTGKN